MSQSKQKFSTIKIYSRDPNGAPTGANTVIEMDGVKLPHVTFVKVEASAKKMTKVLIEMFAHVEVDVIGDLHTKILDLKDRS